MGLFLYFFPDVRLVNRRGARDHFPVAVVANSASEAVSLLIAFQNIPIGYVTNPTSVRMQNEHISVGVIAWGGPL